MWKLNSPKPVKLVIGILAADEASCNTAVAAIEKKFGKIDLISPIWTFTHTTYYKDELGENAVKQYVSIEKLISPGRIAKIKHITNRMEQKLAKKLDTQFARPVNIDPGYIETSKLVLATTKNFSHRIYIGKKMWAEVTLSYVHGKWISYEFTFPDHKDDRYHGFLSQVREKLAAQLKNLNC